MTIRAVIYARHSTDMQDKSSQDQIARCEKLCSQKGYRVETVYTDEGVSGALIVNRPNIQQLLNDAELRKFDRVICEDLSRLSRSMGEMAHIHQTLSFHEVTIETPVDGEVTQLHVGMRGIINDIFRADLSDKTKRGQIATVLRGTIPLGKIYGYNKVHAFDDFGQPIKGKFEINETEAVIVRRIFDMHLEGIPPLKITEILTDEGIPTSTKGGKWSYSTIIGSPPYSFGTLTQPLYKGQWIYNRTERHKHPVTGRSEYRLRPEATWIEMNVPELKIVEADIFDRVQQQLQDRREKHEEHQAYLDTLSPARKAKRERDSLLRSKQKIKRRKSRQYLLFVFSRKIICAVHNGPLRPMRSGIYSCDERHCNARNLSWKEMTIACLEHIATLTDEDVVQAATAFRKHKRQADKMSDRLKEESRITLARIKMLTQVVNPNFAPSTSPTLIVMKELEVKNTELLQQIFEIKEQHHIVLEAKAARAVRKRFLKALKAFRYDLEDQDMTRKLNECITAVKLEAWSDWKTVETKLAAQVTLDYFKVFTEFGSSA